MGKSIGIVGQGFVGSAIREGMSPYFNVETYDIDKTKGSSCNSLPELIAKTEEILFVCLPTPMNSEGRCDTRLVETAVSDINDECIRVNRKIIAVVKSTIEPGTTDRLNYRYSNVTVVFNPEFLTEANRLLKQALTLQRLSSILLTAF
jgi:UDP-glucose 6-dehydrogenase